jgi:glycosyltransferase involved in cell wall biosynthesis
MKIVHTCNRYYPYFGGLETHVQNLSENMVQLGHEVDVYSTDPTGKLPKAEVINGVNVHRFKCVAPQDSYFFSPSLYQSLRAANCDVIHGHDLNGFPLLAGALAKRSKKYVATLHVGAFSSRFRTLARIPYDRGVMHHFLKRANKIICVSEYERTIYERVLNLPSTKFLVIPNGYDSTTNQIKSPMHKDIRFLLSVGRLEKSKGFHYLLESFALVSKNSDFADLHLVIVGKGPYEAQLRSLISKLGLTEKVHIYQNIPRTELLGFYAQCAAFVLLSNYESQGLAVWDAFAFQKPTITSTSAVLGEYARQGYSVGVTLPPNLGELAAKIGAILRNPSKFKPPKYPMLSWTQVANRTVDLYSELLSSSLSEKSKFSF